MTLLTPEVLSILIIDFLFLIFGAIAFYLSIKIFLNWNLNSTTLLQYNLEKQSYLVATIIKYILLLKLPLFLYFIFTQDKLSTVIPGAMCAAGVVDATKYGIYLFLFKIVNLYLFGIWLVIHKIDVKSPNYPFTKIKFGLFAILFVLLVIEISIEFLMFYEINPSKIVSCCGTLFSTAKTSYLASFLSIPKPIILTIFYLNFLAIVLLKFLKQEILFGVANLIFVIISILSLISFFSTYIYELPTHHCPFCLLQSDYYYVGYILYIFLFMGTFSGISAGILKLFTKENTSRWVNISIFFDTLYLVLVSIYPIIFYIKNGVWL